MTTTDDVLEIERGLWTDGPDAYHRHLDDVCLTAIGATAGVFTRNDVAAMVADGPRWQDLEIDVRGVVEPTDDVAILTYEARAVRGEDERYRALVSSGYVRRNGGWKVMFHQQTPLADE
jgi:Domain of unknown function (DUF4440)